MTNDEIRALALSHGFTLRPQPDGSMDLNPYVYGFARAMFEQGRGDLGLLFVHFAHAVILANRKNGATSAIVGRY